MSHNRCAQLAVGVLTPRRPAVPAGRHRRAAARHRRSGRGLRVDQRRPDHRPTARRRGARRGRRRRRITRHRPAVRADRLHRSNRRHRGHPVHPVRPVEVRPRDRPDHGADLSQSRAQIDAFNKTMVEEIALHWNSLHTPDCGATLTQMTEAVAAARGLDPLYRRALSSATRSYCALT